MSALRIQIPQVADTDASGRLDVYGGVQAEFSDTGRQVLVMLDRESNSETTMNCIFSGKGYPETSSGPFLAVSKPILASKCSLFSVIRDTQDSKKCAPLGAQMFN